MSMSIVDRGGLLNAELRQLAERRLRFALARFDTRVDRATLVVSDVNGPRRGIDKSLRITVKLRRAARVEITDQDADLATCIARAAERLNRAVSRAIARTHQLDRSLRSVNKITPSPERA